MTGISPSGAAVAVRRPSFEPHPAKHATVAELRSTLINGLRAYEVPEDQIARALGISTRTSRRIVAATPPIQLR